MRSFWFLLINFSFSLSLLAGEWAIPKRVKEEKPPPSVIWGPFVMPDLRGLGWGLYGLCYNPLLNKLDAVYFWQSYIRRYRSADSTNPAYPETIRVSLISSPVGDSFQDFTFSHYDNAIWIHSSKYKRVYKIDADNGTLLREFPSPARRYPVGIAFNEREKKLYLIDRMDEGVFPCSLYVTDTLGRVLSRFSLAHLGYSYAGARCLDLDWTNSNPTWPSLLLLYSYFSGSGVLDSCALFELDPQTGAIIHRAKLPDLAGYINNARGVAWDPRTGDYWISIMQSPDNYLYKLDGWYTPYSTDVGIVALIAPFGADSLNRVITPRVVVRNFGTTTQTFPVRMRIGQNYDETRNKTLPPGVEDTVNFPNWVAQPSGYVSVRCSTGLSGDMFSRNDIWIDSFLVLAPPVIRDVGVQVITSPPLLLDSGRTITPSCTVYNYGNQNESYEVRFKIGEFYDQTASVSNHSPGTKVFLTFPDWVAQQRGNWTVSCSTELSGDQNPNNDKRTASVLVRVRDVGCLLISSPPEFVDSGVVITPSCTVYNYGNSPESYSIRFKISNFYNETVSVSNHEPGEKIYLTFPDWTALQVGTHPVKCSTELEGDFYPNNDFYESEVTVGVLDCGVREIFAPRGIIDSGTVVIPRVLVKNFGNLRVEFPTWFFIGENYSDSVWTGLAPRESAVIEFSPWRPTICDTFEVKSWTILRGDRNLGNDTSSTWVIVRRPIHDVGTVLILAPTGEIDSGTVVFPKVILQNFGTSQEEFWVRFTIGDFYLAETTWALNVGEEDTVSFRDWIASPLGVHIVKCTTQLTGDIDPTNDRQLDSVKVILRPGVKFIETEALSSDNLTFTPNPFTDRTTLSGEISFWTPVLIYNASGILVRSLSNRTWDGRDEKGNLLPKGIYFYHKKGERFNKQRKVIKL
uniref:T9SS type A sorting domain-containing protein n=1 Tax=candidate division WOR-3 bacterium TaxID=2052148 RepID=A0A7C3UQV7_UNCW3